jgi:acyl carrier protein
VEKCSFDQELTADTAFTDLDIDSLVMLELAVILRREYEVQFDEEELLASGTVKGLVSLIEQRRSV